MFNLFNMNTGSNISTSMFSGSLLNESFVDNAIELLESVNKTLTENEKTLYTKISEAEEVQSENEALKQTISMASATLNELLNKITLQKSKFIISATNYKDMMSGLADDIDLEKVTPYSDKYSRFNVDKLSNSEFPRIGLFNAFEREFNFIGQLLQELPATSSYKDKFNVVATVYNNFSKVINGDLNTRVCKDMLGDLYNPEVSFAKSVTLAFREDPSTKTIDSEDLMDAKECIENISDYINSISQSYDSLQSSLESVIQKLYEVITNGDINKIKIDTKTDGIRNTTYSVDSYTTNKMLWFTNEKLTQISKIVSKYMIALSIKSEMVLAYISQSSEIIKSMIYGAKVTSEPTEKSDDNNGDISDDLSDDTSESGDDLELDTSNDDGDTSTDNTGESSDDLSDDNSSDNTVDEYELEDDVDNNAAADSSTDEAVPNFDLKDDEEVQEAVREFYIGLYECQEMYNECMVMEHVSCLLEDGEQTSTDNKPDATDSIKGTKELVGKIQEKKKSIWKSVIDNIVNLWNKFKDAVLTRYQKKVDFLKSNKKLIKSGKIDHKIEMPKIDHTVIDQITIPDFNWNTMKDHLDSEEAFMKSQTTLSKFMPSGNDKDGKKETISSVIKNMVISPTDKYTNAKELEPAKMYDEYCVKFIDILNDMKKMTDVIEKGEKNADQLAKQFATTPASESTITMEELYFLTEADFKAAKDDDKDKGSKENTDIENKLKVYFSTCGKVLAAKMTVSQKVFDEYYAYLAWHISQKNGGKKAEGETKEEGNNDNGEGSRFN